MPLQWAAESEKGVRPLETSDPFPWPSPSARYHIHFRLCIHRYIPTGMMTDAASMR
jgi:hypothetical protein